MLEQSSLPFPAPETWRAVPGYESRYEISDRGRVRSLRCRGFGLDRVRSTPLVMRPFPSHNGHLRVKLSGQKHWVHRLVLEAFVGPCPDGCEASHLNGQALDNRSENLVWETHAENNARRWAHGTIKTGDESWSRQHPERLARGDRSGARLHPDTLARGDRNGTRLHPERVARGERNGSAKLTAAQVREIRQAVADGETRVSVGRRYAVSDVTVGDIVRGTIWGSV